MSQRVEKLQALLSLAERLKKPIFVALPGAVTLLWMMALSDNFAMNALAIKSGIFVFVAVLVPVAFAHTVLLVVLTRKLSRAKKDARVPKASARIRADKSSQ